MYPQPFHPTSNIKISVATFTLFYLLYIIHKTSKDAIDVVDLLLLSAVAVVPASFVFLPRFSELLAELLGVSFPFLIMFGLLILVLFSIIHHKTILLHKLNKHLRQLTQEVAILKLEIDSIKNTQQKTSN